MLLTLRKCDKRCRLTTQQYKYQQKYATQPEETLIKQAAPAYFSQTSSTLCIFLKSCSSFATLTLCLMLVCLLPATILAGEEGDSCTIKNINGVCRAASQCEDTIERYIKNGQLVPDDIPKCGLTPHEEIICCPDEFPGRVSPERPAVRVCNQIEANLSTMLTPHIIGGTPVEREEYPHMAAIAFESPGAGQQSYSFLCGGTLIDKRFVLTAAHCVINNETQPIFVRLGMINIYQDVSQSSDGQQIDIKEVYIHPNYTMSIKYDDVAILELKEDARYSATIYPACLYTELEDPPNVKPIEYYVAGWGTVNYRTRKVSGILLKARLEIVSLSKCNQSYAIQGRHHQLPRGIETTQLCANDPGFTKDSCQGDSGGPLIQVRDPTIKSFRIVGIISTGFGCVTRTPGLYTRVASYLDYIENIVWKTL